MLFPLLQDSSVLDSLRDRAEHAANMPATAMRFPGGALTWDELRGAVTSGGASG